MTVEGARAMESATHHVPCAQDAHRRGRRRLSSGPPSEVGSFACTAPAAMAMDPTVLQIACGSCGRQVNVPSSLLEQLLVAGQFNCPNCGSTQQVG